MALGLVCACSQQLTQGSGDEQVAEQGLHLTSGVGQSADVAGILFQLMPVNCADGTPLAEPKLINRPLEDQKIPGGIEGLENSPLDADSAHLFADAFQALDAGCYDVTATPVQKDGSPSNGCAAAFKKHVEVKEGQTSEILLINQCHGIDAGALDAISALNHEPQIEDVSFESSKFVSCGGTQTLCATVSDPDKDPLELVWKIDGDSPPTSGPTVVKHSVDAETGTVTECVAYTPSQPGKYPVTLDAYDLLWKDGKQQRVEDWLTAEGYPHESHAHYDFFFYVTRELAASTDPADPGGVGAPVAPTSTARHHAPEDKVLILDSTVSGGMSSPEAQAAIALGLGVDIVDAKTWQSKTLADFQKYRAIILGDATCGSDFSPAEVNSKVWGAAADGEVVLIGTDETFHGPGHKLTSNAMSFITSDPTKTGAMVSLSCHYAGASADTHAPVLDGFGAFTVTAVGACYNEVHIVATHPTLASLTDADLSNWSCSVHEGFDHWPSNFTVLAIADESGDVYTSGDGHTGTPYILARGVTSLGCGDGSVVGAEECDDGNNVDGDGCDSNCRIEKCGNGVLQGTEQCDDGNVVAGDGCSPECTFEPCTL